ncbi:WD repeat-containing protein 6 isoform X2 [Nasonia vitripennis]|uniref:tRNA (34-2'-O)-methyltransferase regulator WDR6 n=1 Tax=Nasonia vitripennis TaxID=7425 RepID=A0A7M7QCJ3_NASVI|nr:WD repeat-containing protein 6 isoform X2 [Nasonia vitripennis]
MNFSDLSTDVLAVKCISNYVFIGIGCKLYAICKTDYKIKIKIDALHPDNIHGIVIKSNSKLIVYGGKSLCVFDLNISDNDVSINMLDKIHRFDDWIIDVDWLGSLRDSTLTILFAHNNVYNYDLSDQNFTNTACNEICLLYAGTISGQNYEKAIIFSGTVFQEILIWSINNKTDNRYSEVLHRLKGHKGVIFSIFYNPTNNLICSTSDDRTVRLWKVSSENMDDQNPINWVNAKISLQTTMYGHLARVWRAVLFKSVIISIGEDSRICFWNLSGELIHKIEAHQGASIWCIDISEDDIVYTGGADGYVNCWPLGSIKSYMENHILLENKDIIPKNVNFIDDGDVFIFINCDSSNKILHFCKKQYQLKYTYDVSDYPSTYCIMELSLNRQRIALASIKGEVTLYDKTQSKWMHSCTYKVMDSKIYSMQWLDHDIVATCGSEGVLLIIKFVSNGIQVLSEHILPPSRERWTTSACMHKNLLICGDRMGSIFIYKLDNNSKNPLQSFKKIHGRLGVQSCSIIDSNLISTGRDGTLRFYTFSNVDSITPTVNFLYTKSTPMDWASRLLKIENNHYVLGFKEEDFVIYDVRLKRILLTIHCGGGHRSWDCIIKDKLIKFVYIQKRKVCTVTIPLNKICIPPLLSGFHKKEIYCIKTLPLLSKHHNILISGGEDCSFHINYINSSTSKLKPNFKLINNYDGHLSSGRAQLKIWEIIINFSESTFVNEDLSCKDLLSYMLHGPDKERNKIWVGKELMYNADPETRYMDISTLRNPDHTCDIFIFIACSDGYLRTLNYNVESNEIKLIDSLAYKSRCILKVHAFLYKKKILIMSMATDGLLNFWHFSASNEIVSIRNLPIDDKLNISLHQSGINSFDIKVVNDSEYILATGGDDNLLSLLIFEITLTSNEDLFIRTKSSWKSTSSHHAQITGLKLLNDNRLVSVGTDKQLLVHKYSVDGSKISSILVEEKTLCISDVQGLTLCENQMTNTELFCIYGKGLQLLKNSK